MSKSEPIQCTSPPRNQTLMFPKKEGAKEPHPSASALHPPHPIPQWLQKGWDNFLLVY